MPILERTDSKNQIKHNIHYKRDGRILLMLSKYNKNVKDQVKITVYLKNIIEDRNYRMGINLNL